MTDLNKLFTPLFLSEKEIKKIIELMFFSYRDFTSGPDKVLEKIKFGRAHHRVIYFVGKKEKITIRDLNDEDKLERKLKKGIDGVVITNIQSDSPVVNLLKTNDIIIEVQKEKILNSPAMLKKIKKYIAKGDKTLLLTIYNSQNQRRQFVLSVV